MPPNQVPAQQQNLKQSPPQLHNALQSSLTEPATTSSGISRDRFGMDPVKFYKESPGVGTGRAIAEW
ncbi:MULTISPECIES: hypothetical protein [unclassified Leptolyngbya]|uniref:hypothetical protein n=1 Tax=unclassified Leptolyngbya TaxID=2650499 RepID=UPI0016867AA5|nr:MULTISPECIES: hypothetical protein [unclassified Leptolyngbya]MBD1911194.1 hypothetical protein [Leptolyngbya sp. FACHB-8]MBD2155441.1 hypothetical protein [Leptolyngbya sp. FACHB-16]